MIRYALTCSEGHAFDSWFQSSSAFDALAERGLVACAVCGTTQVSKSLMAPKITAKKPAAPNQDNAETGARPMAAGPLSGQTSEIAQKLAELRKHVEENSTYVGRDFADEARKMHLGEVPERQIHGEATANQARDLIDDGVPVLPLPGVPRSQTN
ncbi:MAG: DUF1178 family protein [Pseudomonadota bacterium]